MTQRVPVKSKPQTTSSKECLKTYVDGITKQLQQHPNMKFKERAKLFGEALDELKKAELALKKAQPKRGGNKTRKSSKKVSNKVSKKSSKKSSNKVSKKSSKKAAITRGKTRNGKNRTFKSQH